MMMILIRPRAWWLNKVPLSVLTGLLLLDGRPLTLSAFLSFAALVCAVSCVANYGYALNELFDVDEDRRGQRTNAAQQAGPRRMWLIIGLSAATALLLASAAGGTAGALLTAGELLIPLAYSIPPLRLKNRGWPGILCDASAAHVYPAMLALLILFHQGLRSPDALIVIAAALWSLMTGLRGILSHQLQSEEHDRAAGLVTVVHALGHRRLVLWVKYVILPLEIAAFAAFISQCDVGSPFVAVAAVYILYELAKSALNAFPVVVFTKSGERYLPFVDEGFYKVWGPLMVALDATAKDLRYVGLIPITVALFRPRMAAESNEMKRSLECARAWLSRTFPRAARAHEIKR